VAESDTVWNVLIKQCGAIKVDSLEEMVDTAKALVYLKPSWGNRVGLMAMTGGQSVVITDTFSKAGLEVPLLAEKSYQRLASFFNIIGGSYRNPLDIATSFYWVRDPVGNLAAMLEVLKEDTNVDALVLELSVAFGGRLTSDAQFREEILNMLSDFKNRSQKPFLVILVATHQETLALEVREKLVERGIASFPSFERGARALKRIVEYYRFCNS